MIVGIAGEEGTGKSTSLKNLDPKRTFIIKPNNKPLPWGGWRKDYQLVQTKAVEKDGKKKVVFKGNIVRVSTLKEIAVWSKRAASKKIKNEEGDLVYAYDNVVIEDITHFFNIETMNETFMGRKEKGEARAKWNEFGSQVIHQHLIGPQAEIDREDYMCFMLFHSEQFDGELGTEHRLRVKGSVSKDIPSYFTYFMYTKVYSPDEESEIAKRYRIVTNRDGIRPAKSSAGVFPLEIPNDLQMVRDRIFAYENGEELPPIVEESTEEA